MRTNPHAQATTAPTAICGECNHDPHPRTGCEACGADGPCHVLPAVRRARTSEAGRELATLLDV
ncbi:MAG: hypothetical protein AB7R89_11545 [Dehalococcoidia bacterium]